MSGRKSRSAEETERLGEALGPSLRIGDVLLLSGPLGAGKTRFVTGLARGMACKARVRSPTFALVHEYGGIVPLAHLDLYRLSPREAEGLGIDELLECAALVVEWGEKLPAAWSTAALRLEFSAGGDPNERLIHASAAGARGEELCQEWMRLSARGPSERIA